ncbi:TNT domain-containing protein [Isobaculum melis]|nr:glycohydrolase toxin TNT-related protein [Isobaculum melis]
MTKDIPEAQKLNYEDYQQYLMYSHAFIYHSLDDKTADMIKGVVVNAAVISLGFVPIVGPILGVGFGIMEMKEAIQGVDGSGRELDIFERIFKGALAVTSISFSGWKLVKDIGGLNAFKGVSGAKGTGNYNKGYVTGEEWEKYFKKKYGTENVEHVTKTTISSTERAKLNSWGWPPSDELYLKYKDIYNNDLYFNQVTGAPRYPANDGFLSDWPDIVGMAKGDVIDRIGSNGSGQYFSPVGSTFESRALPPFMQTQPYTKYKVLRPFETTTGKVAPWFGQPGAGTQHYTNFLIKDRYGNLIKANVENLLEWGYIIPIE